ncbi:methyltransferase domain-containing protein [Aliigemmobacter aestuarii]|uniref:Methyltransferase domain-containing protein n=1 Tax=Aliigemmobacter aestuarii TaxID=1445661 RepID=A0A4S3MSX5_9RHOB|nr:methyltransferase domain-containing protein [Gemmobacter aestuarii]THD84965.1 methyltransferase domain-containing protein [Gemmobacter aestuarii]
MHLDVLDLRNFYYRTQLGRVAQRAIRDQLVSFWPNAQGQTVAGFGFAVPLLRPFLTDARRVIGLMPAPQGVMPWPAGMENVSVLCEETNWPLATGMVDRLVLMHGLETSENPSAVLAEAHRVLGPGGRAVFVVPNRSGLWARRDGTPFGFGRPYSLSQLEAQLRRHEFTPERHLSVLHAPPSHQRFWMRMAGVLEGAGRRFAPWLAGGVLMVEASKQVYAPTRGGLGAVVRRPLRVLEGVGQPVPSPRLPKG